VRGPRVRFIPLAAVVVGLVITGCGSDSSGERAAPSVSIPAVTAPGISTVTRPAATAAPGTTTKGGKRYNPNLPDSATNDVPPPKGSPQAQFEQQCRQHPSACG
jgi:hypothetical protein